MRILHAAALTSLPYELSAEIGMGSSRRHFQYILKLSLQLRSRSTHDHILLSNFSRQSQQWPMNYPPCLDLFYLAFA